MFFIETGGMLGLRAPGVVGTLSRGVVVVRLSAGLPGLELMVPPEDLRADTFQERGVEGIWVVGVRGPLEVVGEERADVVTPVGDSPSSTHSK